MSKTVRIGSTSQFTELLETSKGVIAEFHANWCGACRQFEPIYEDLSTKLSRPNKVTFVKVDTEQQQAIAQSFKVTALPTFIIFKNKEVVMTIIGSNAPKLNQAVEKLAAEVDTEGDSGLAGGSGGNSTWLGSALPRGYKDVTNQVDLLGLDLLNSSSDFGKARTLFEVTKPSALDSGKGKGNSGAEESKKDWVESDTDEQLMLFIPFQASLKIHSLHITSLPPQSSEGQEDEIPMRPKTVQIYSNRAHVLGFEEAEDIPATQAITLGAQEWDENTGTAKLELRFVKFQNVSSLVIFVLDGDGDGEKVRIDRLRIVGEKGEKRDLGKLEKIGDQPGE